MALKCKKILKLGKTVLAQSCKEHKEKPLSLRGRGLGGGFQYIPLMWTGKGIREANEYNANLRRIILWYFWNSA